MTFCSIRWCGKNSKTSNFKKDGITFHRFPRDPETKEKWINASRRENWFPSEYNVVCSRHFTPDCFLCMKNRRRLLSSAVPSLYLPLLTAQSQPQRKPDRLPFSSSEESDDDRGDEDNSIYERDVSPIRTEDAGDATVPEGSSRCHVGYRCDVCRGQIVGFRYTCVQCANFDLCGACEARGQHAEHYVLRVPASKLHTNVQAVVKMIRDQLLEANKDENTIKFEIKEEVLDQDPLQTTCPAGEKLQETKQETSCQEKESEESNDTLTVKFLDRSGGNKQPVFEVSMSHQPSVSQDQSHQLKPNLQIPSDQSQVMTHQPASPQILSHKSAAPQASSHETAVQSQKPKILIQKPKVQPKVPQVISHQPATPQVLSKQSKILIQKPKVQPKVPQIITHPPAVPQVLSHKPAAPQVLSHSPSTPQVSSHQTAVLSHQPKILILQPKGQSKRPKVLSHQSQEPQMVSHQPQVSAATTSREKRPLTVEIQGVGTVLVRADTAAGAGGPAAGGGGGGGAAPGEGGDFAVYTHSAETIHGREHDTPSEELSSTGEDPVPTRKKRKK